MRTDLSLTPWRILGKTASWHDDFFESVFFLGNGRIGIRGYCPGEPDHRPIQKGIYLAGIFGEIKPGITDIVNLPTPVFDEISIDGRPAKLATEVAWVLDMHAATINARYTLEAAGKCVDVEYSRFLPKDHPALIMQRTVFTPCADMELIVRSGIMTDSCNCPIPDDQTKSNVETMQLSSLESAGAIADGLRCSFNIRGSNLRVTEEIAVKCPSFSFRDYDNALLTYTANAAGGQRLYFDKAACVLTNRDVDPRIAPIPENWSYDLLLKDHAASWAKTWTYCDTPIPQLDEELQTGLHFSMFQLMGSCSAKDPTVSIGARGLTHGRYKGCYFWDTDFFMLPFFLKNDSEAARNLCEYRVRSLPAAKAHSRSMNTAGARYPWMAALDGSEQCESWDIGCSELHITADVAYALGVYCEISQDEDFYLDHAAQVFIETARFWVSRYTYRSETGSADLLFCKGPDEYCGITNNNLFTNVMVQHNLDLAVKAAVSLRHKRPGIYSALGLSQEEIDRMVTLREAIKWPRDPYTGDLAQDETFHLLEDVNVGSLKQGAGASYHDICFDRLQRYKVVKQADVLLLMTRFPDLFTSEEKLAAWQKFEPLCLHDSTLSFASHALFALQNGMKEAGYEYLRKALLLDLRDVMGNTGHEGLHLACMGEGWQAAQALL